MNKHNGLLQQPRQTKFNSWFREDRDVKFPYFILLAFLTKTIGNCFVSREFELDINNIFAELDSIAQCDICLKFETFWHFINIMYPLSFYPQSFCPLGFLPTGIIAHWLCLLSTRRFCLADFCQLLAGKFGLFVPFCQHILITFAHNFAHNFCPFVHLPFTHCLFAICPLPFSFIAHCPMENFPKITRF